MLPKSVLAAVSLAMLAITAPASHAAVTTSLCGGVVRITPDGSIYTGVLFGYAAFDDTATHTLRCYVNINGVAWLSTPESTGQVVVTTSEVINEGLYPDPTATVDECTEIDGGTVECHPMAVVRQPDEDDVLGTVFATIVGLEHTVVDPILCPLLASLSPGLPPVVTIDSEGDLALFGTGTLYDCPPYGV
jgi:hypothetical protein